MTLHIQPSHSNPSEFIQSLIGVIKKNQLGSDFQGFSDEEIKQVMQSQNVESLPHIFRLYLKYMGHNGFNRIFRGSDFDFDSMLYDKESLLTEIEIFNSPKNNNIELPDNIFVFMSHQGYSYLYFISDKHDSNPSVYRYSGHDIQEIYENLTDFFTEELNNYIKRRENALGSNIDKLD